MRKVDSFKRPRVLRGPSYDVIGFKTTSTFDSPCGAESSSVGQGMFCVYGTRRGLYSVHKHPPLEPVLSQVACTSPSHTLFCCKIHFVPVVTQILPVAFSDQYFVRIYYLGRAPSSITRRILGEENKV
jgi:hypothetical protein